MSAILVLEDNNELQNYLVTVLRSAGHAVTGISQSQRGLELVREHNFDLLLLDVTLADGDAFEFLRKAKLENVGFDPKICFVSSRRDSETVQKAVTMGAVDYIVKPVLTGTLLDKVKKLLGEKLYVETYSAVTCHFEANLCDQSFSKPDLVVTEVSETGVKFRSSSDFQGGAVVPIAVLELQHLIGFDGPNLMLRIAKCEKSTWGRYLVEAEYIGLGEERLAKIRAFAIRGAFLSSPTHKKPA